MQLTPSEKPAKRSVEKRFSQCPKGTSSMLPKQPVVNRHPSDVRRVRNRTTISAKESTSYPQGRIKGMELRSIQAVAFDMDGLMLNTEDLYAQVGNTLMERRGRQYREAVRRQMIGLPAEHAFGVLIREEQLSDSWQDLQKETDEIFDAILPTQLTKMAGLVELMDHLDQRQLPRCVATSSTSRFARKALSQVGMLERVDFVITAEDVTRGKPHPDIYLASAARMSIPIENILVLEDSPTGTRAGASAGAYVVSVPNQHTRHEKFEGSQWIADTLLDSRIYELIGY
jgi:HAD superfamily hydrolase (TIGR01509 family)